MFIRFVTGALRYRRQRLLLAFGALTVAAALATVLLGIYGTVGKNVSEQFRGYGANIVVAPINADTVPLAVVASAEKLGAKARPILITTGKLDAYTVPVVGMDSAPSGVCSAGELLAKRLNLKTGTTLLLEKYPCTLRAIVSTGGPEDQELIVSFDAAATLANIHDAASAIELRADHPEAVRNTLAAQYPQVDFRIVRAVAATENNVVFKVRAALFLLSLLVLTITTLCVTSNYSEIVLERATEIGIMKALGGAERRIASFFLSESAALAVLATLTGYVAGVFATAAISREIFGGGFHPQGAWSVFFGVAAVMLFVAVLATSIAASRIWSIQPAAILRGE